MLQRWLLSLALAVLFIFAPASQAFHDAIGECKEGDIGYLATMLDDNGRFLGFLSTAIHPTPATIMCQIDPEQWIKILGRGKKV